MPSYPKHTNLQYTPYFLCWIVWEWEGQGCGEWGCELKERKISTKVLLNLCVCTPRSYSSHSWKPSTFYIWLPGMQAVFSHFWTNRQIDTKMHQIYVCFQTTEKRKIKHRRNRYRLNKVCTYYSTLGIAFFPLSLLLIFPLPFYCYWETGVSCHWELWISE